MRIAGITIPDSKRLEISMTTIHGIGRPLARKILEQAKIDYGKKPAQLSTDEEAAIRRVLEEGNYLIEGELRREVSSHIKRLKDIGSYRGSRHSRGLPARGQRSKTNARTRKGPRKTMGSGKRKVDKK